MTAITVEVTAVMRPRRLHGEPCIQRSERWSGGCHQIAKRKRHNAAVLCGLLPKGRSSLQFYLTSALPRCADEYHASGVQDQFLWKRWMSAFVKTRAA